MRSLEQCDAMADQQQQRDPRYSWIYQELTKDDGDDFVLVNSIAYIIYKRKKIEFYELNNGSPSQEQKTAFHQIYSMPLGLDGLRAEARIIVSELLNASLQEQIEEVETRLEATLTAEMKGTITTLNSTITSNHTVTDSKLTSLTVKDGKWWASQIATGTLVTFISTLLFWFGAYAYLGKSMFGTFEGNNTPIIQDPHTSKIGNSPNPTPVENGTPP